MASLSERARRRSSLFFSNNFNLSSLVKSSATPSEQSSYSDLKHGIRHNSPATVGLTTGSKHTSIEPLFQESYLVSKEYLTSEDEQSSADSQEPASPTFSADYEFDDEDDAALGDEYDKMDPLDDFGLGLAMETYKPSDVARKVSIIVCKPKQVYITPPTSPTSPLFARATPAVSPLRHSYAPMSTPADMDTEAMQASYFGNWYAAYDRQNIEFSACTKSNSTSSRTSSSAGSESSRYTSATTVSNDSMLPADNFLVSPQRPKTSLGRANALKRNSNRYSTSFPRSFQAKATEEDVEQMPPPHRSTTSPISPAETIRPTTSVSMRPVVEAARPSTSSAAPRATVSQIPNFSRPERFPPPPEIPRSNTPMLKKKKSIADVWFKRKSVGNVLGNVYI